MKSFVVAMILLVVVTVAASFALNMAPTTSAEKFSINGSTRL